MARRALRGCGAVVAVASAGPGAPLIDDARCRQLRVAVRRLDGGRLAVLGSTSAALLVTDSARVCNAGLCELSPKYAAVRAAVLGQRGVATWGCLLDAAVPMIYTCNGPLVLRRAPADAVPFSCIYAASPRMSSCWYTSSGIPGGRDGALRIIALREWASLCVSVPGVPRGGADVDPPRTVAVYREVRRDGVRRAAWSSPRVLWGPATNRQSR